MCDTVLAPPASTAAGTTIFGKNSDRQRNEAQAVDVVGGAEHAADVELRTTYLTIPQARATHAVLLSRPYWMWGAEMGANEHGVVIGNEGLYSRRASPQEPALLGMDLIRLGLERGATATEALEVITTLLARHGQGGNGGHLEPGYYHNGFMIADAREAYVVETVDRDWVVERVGDVRAISNEYSVGGRIEACSTGVPALLRELGWDGAAPPDHASFWKDPARSHVGSAHDRLTRSTTLLRRDRGAIAVADVQRILRDHGGGPGTWDPTDPHLFSVCVHGGAPPRIAQTAGSLVSDVRPDGSAVHWTTATSTPCIGIFKPVLLDVPLPDRGPRLSGRVDPATVWWRHERTNRAAVFAGFAAFEEGIAAERDALEADFRGRVAAIADADAPDRARVVADCWREAAEVEERWYARVAGARPTAQDAYHAAWIGINDAAGLPAVA